MAKRLRSVGSVEIELEEAMRRATAMSIRQGYKVMSKWTNKYYDDGEKEPLWSMALVGFENTRILLWKEKDHWRATISVKVGKDGEFPICDGFVQRNIKDKFMPAFGRMEAKIAEIRTQVHHWGFSSASPYISQALARLALYYMQEKKQRKARSVVVSIINGMYTAATVAEALSMIQSNIASSRADRLESALIWSEVFR